MQFTIVTGMSGAGKTQVVKYLEDAGYFCIDNMPPALIPKFAEMLLSINNNIAKVAVVTDMRVGEMINELLEQVNILKKNGYDCRLLFINADDVTLVKRYKETRRVHPMNNPKGLLASIQEERQKLSKLYMAADTVIDTSKLKSQELSQKLKNLYSEDGKMHGISINVMAFGFKYGMPLDADLVFDVRCFPNPFYIEELRTKTGNDKEVQDYVMSFKEAQQFFEKLCDMISFLIPLYIEEGKMSLTIAIGCTGGRHRSVTMANKLADYLKENGYMTETSCRDVDRG